MIEVRNAMLAAVIFVRVRAVRVIQQVSVSFVAIVRMNDQRIGLEGGQNEWEANECDNDDAEAKQSLKTKHLYVRYRFLGPTARQVDEKVAADIKVNGDAWVPSST